MRSTRDIALEILEISKRDISDEVKIELIASVVQDYNEDVISETKIIY